MRFQTSFHVGSTRGYRGNGKLIIEMKPTSFSYHGGQLCVSPLCSVPFSTVCSTGMCPAQHLASASPHQSIQTYSRETSAAYGGGEKWSLLSSENVIEIVADQQRKDRALSCLSTCFIAFRPFHSKSTNKSIFQVGSGVVMTSHCWL